MRQKRAPRTEIRVKATEAAVGDLIQSEGAGNRLKWVPITEVIRLLKRDQPRVIVHVSTGSGLVCTADTTLTVRRIAPQPEALTNGTKTNAEPAQGES